MSGLSDDTDLKLLVAKYSDTNTASTATDTSVDSKHRSLDSELLRENEELRAIVKEQEFRIAALKSSMHDKLIEYNCKIDALRDEHTKELANLHNQFKIKLAKELNKDKMSK